MDHYNVAIFDPKAFYPFRSLVQGGLHDIDDLQRIERFVRASVLHDEMNMVIEPWPFDPVADEEERKNNPGPRNVITGIGPVLTGYEELLSHEQNIKPITEIEISPNLISVAAEFSNAPAGNVYYDAHIKFVGKLLAISKHGGSIICEGDLSRAMELRATVYPEKLFENLDKDWQEYALTLEAGKFGISIPPILNIILTRCKKREDIPENLKLLREEWAGARKKVWNLLRELQNAKTLKKARQVQQELDDASKHFSPLSPQTNFSPTRILWNLFSESGSGAIDSLLAGGNPMLGATAAAVRSALTNLAQDGRQFGNMLFGRGAFDLARRTRRKVMNSNAQNTLSRFLTEEEKHSLGF